MIESQDRYNNAVSVLGFLNHHFETNIIIHELITKTTKLDFISTLNNCRVFQDRRAPTQPRYLLPCIPRLHCRQPRYLSPIAQSPGTHSLAFHDCTLPA